MAASLGHKSPGAASREARPGLLLRVQGDQPQALSLPLQTRCRRTDADQTPSQTRLDTPLHAHCACLDKPKTPCRVCQTLPGLQMQTHTAARLPAPRGRQSVRLSLTDTRTPGLSEAPGCLCSAPAWTCWSGLLTVGCWAEWTSMLRAARTRAGGGLRDYCWATWCGIP